ncbi:hypothetical protein BDN70DRAFT_891669 [Pholiota conissans]|uniref:Uncharacterized protein n=1 Tax=Pholiota conissans TaxID=109636 RepID=A0A9P5Z8V1_9AGAR|nr:hypothetical protein BDN70DRAFT_891669 [Pholiota conissans]
MEHFGGVPVLCGWHEIQGELVSEAFQTFTNYVKGRSISGVPPDRASILDQTLCKRTIVTQREMRAYESSVFVPAYAETRHPRELRLQWGKEFSNGDACNRYDGRQVVPLTNRWLASGRTKLQTPNPNPSMCLADLRHVSISENEAPVRYIAQTSNVYTRLTSLFQSFFKRPSKKGKSGQKTTSAPVSPFVPLPESIASLDIEEYVRLIKIQAVMVPRRLSQLDEHLVVKVELIKNTENKQEYIIATVQDHDKNIARLCVRRSKAATTPAKLQYDARKTVVFDGDAQAYVVQPTTATDVVRNIGLEPNSHSLVSTFVPSPLNALHLLHFVSIVRKVHIRENKYALLNSQCSWFSMMIFGMATTLGGTLQIYNQGKSKNASEQIVEKTMPADQPVDFGLIFPPRNKPRAPKKRMIPEVKIEISEIQKLSKEAEQDYKKTRTEFMQLEEEVKKVQASFVANARRTSVLNTDNGSRYKQSGLRQQL